jgi:hypothetical protein
VSRVLDLLFGGTFIACAVVQFNDPDPVRWIAIYGAALFGCASPPGARWAGALTGIVAVIAGVWALFVVPEAMQVTTFGDLVAAMDPDRPETEAARELGGLLLVVVWAGTRLVTARFRRDRR